MKTLATFFLTVAYSTYAAANTEHVFQAGYGTLNFDWKEYGQDLQNNTFNIVAEEGNLPQVMAAYHYREGNEVFSLEYSFAQGDVDYLGIPRGAPAFSDKRPSKTDYDIQNIEGRYGAFFDVDYITPYAAIIGGYHRRERDINPFEGSTGGAVETYRNYYVGFLMEAEVFSFNNLTIDVGGEFTRTVDSRVDVTSYQVSDSGRTNTGRINVPLKGMSTLKGYARINYEFLPTWEASLSYENSKGDMDESNAVETDTTPFRHPEAELRQSLIELSITKSL